MTTFAPTSSARTFPNISSGVRDVFLVVVGGLLIAASLILPAVWKLTK